MKQWQVREEIEQQILKGIDKGELMTFTFSKSEAAELEWEHDREFEFNGQSYDVVHQEDKVDSITYHVWWDKIESRIKSQLAELVSIALNKDEQQKQNQNQLERFLKGLYHADNTFQEPLSSEFQEVKFKVFVNDYRSLQWSPPVPPPIS